MIIAGMKYKPDWDAAQQRLSALWHHDVLDRPCIAITAPNGKALTPPCLPATPRDKWLDPDWILSDITYRMESTWWGVEAIPSYLLMGGWVLCLGGTPRFEPHTIWFETQPVDFTAPSPFRYTADDPWVPAFTTLYQAAADLAGQDDFLIGKPCMLPANDILSMLMGTSTFLMSLIDHPDWIREAIIAGARAQNILMQQVRTTLQDKHAFWYGNAGWMPFWAPEPFTSTQSDVSCMLSTAMFERFIVPELDIAVEGCGALWYHLDGGDARHHLPRLLSLPYVRVVQYVPAPGEAPNGPGHLDLYRQIQAAGRIVHIEVEKIYVELLVRELNPGLLMLQTACENQAEGEQLLADAKKWM